MNDKKKKKEKKSQFALSFCPLTARSSDSVMTVSIQIVVYNLV